MALTDSLPTRSTTARQIAYDNTLDRIRIELPPSGDPGVVGAAQINLDNWDGALPTILSDREGNEIELPGGALTTVSYEYNRVVAGELYSVSHINPSLPSASSHAYLIDMDPRFNLGLLATIRAAGEFHLRMYEGATVLGSGTQVWAQNFNRTKASGIATKFYYNTWVDPSGTEIFKCITSDDTAGLSTVTRAGWILDQSKNYYVLEVTNRSGTNAASSIEFACIEQGV